MRFYNRTRTLVVTPPVAGITLRQWKAARKILKRHRAKFGSDSGDRLMLNEKLVYAVAMAVSERKHRWDR